MTELPQPLFNHVECWGWEFIPPEAPRRSAELYREPTWAEPTPPDFEQKQIGQAEARERAKDWFYWGGLAVVFGLAALGVTPVIGLVVLAIGCGVVYQGYSIREAPTVEWNSAEERYERDRTQTLAAYARDHAAWNLRIVDHDEAELARYRNAPRWHPVPGPDPSARIDVFGGTKSGWASLLTTSGSTLVGSGTTLTILDFSDNAVAFELSNRVAVAGGQVHAVLLPTDLRHVDLFAGLTVEEIADVLTGAIHAGSDSQRESRELLTLDADILSIVVTNLRGDHSVRRILAGIRVLLGNYSLEDGTLSLEEWAAIQAEAVVVGSTEVQRGRLGLLRAVLNLIVDMGKGDRRHPKQVAHPAACLQPTQDVYVLAATSGHNHRLMELTSALVFQSVMRNIQKLETGAGWRHAVIVAGADHMGVRNLERFADHASRKQIRVVYLFEHLRDDVRPLIGVNGAATVLMQMGNDEEARKAAEYIGKEYRFVLGQLTRTIGRTFSEAVGLTEGGQSGEASTSGYSEGRGRGAGPGGFTSNVSSEFSESFTTSRSKSWGKTVTESKALTETTGKVDQRVYEFTKEPRDLQALAPTAFLLVQHAEDRPPVIAGDCNPGIALLPDAVLERPARPALRPLSGVLQAGGVELSSRPASGPEIVLAKRASAMKAGSTKRAVTANKAGTTRKPLPKKAGATRKLSPKKRVTKGSMTKEPATPAKAPTAKQVLVVRTARPNRPSE